MNIHKVNYYLNWHNPEYQIERIINSAIIAVKKAELDLNALFDISYKESWLNYSRLVKELGYPENKHAIPSLLKLMQDINWPGVTEAVDILGSMPKIDIVPEIEKTIKRAYKETDYQWIYGLEYLVEMLNLAPADFESSDVFDMLALREPE